MGLITGEFLKGLAHRATSQPAEVPDFPAAALLSKAGKRRPPGEAVNAFNGYGPRTYLF